MLLRSPGLYGVVFMYMCSDLMLLKELKSSTKGKVSLFCVLFFSPGRHASLPVPWCWLWFTLKGSDTETLNIFKRSPPLTSSWSPWWVCYLVFLKRLFGPQVYSEVLIKMSFADFGVDGCQQVLVWWRGRRGGFQWRMGSGWKAGCQNCQQPGDELLERHCECVRLHVVLAFLWVFVQTGLSYLLGMEPLHRP